MDSNQTTLMLLIGCILVIPCICVALDFEVVFAIPTLAPDPRYPPHVAVTTSANEHISITLSVPGIGFEREATITKTSYIDISLPTAARMNPGDRKQNKTIIVKSSGPVSVYGIDNGFGDGDGFAAIPSTQLGTRYYVASYVPYHTDHPSFFCVSAPHPNTPVSIKTKSGQMHHIVLSQYESYRFDGDEDLSGTFIQSGQPIAVTSGVYTQVPPSDGISTADGLVEQLPPASVSQNRWGNTFLLAPFLGLNSGFLYRVFTMNISTTIVISPDKTISIEAEDFYEGHVTGDTLVSLTSDQPVMVVQYMKGYHVNNPRSGDPSMLIVPPVTSYTTNATFPVFQYTFSLINHTYYISVITECKKVTGLVFDETTRMADWNRLNTLDQSMCCVRSDVSTGVHSVSHDDPMATFSVSVYAICSSGCDSSYAYPASAVYVDVDATIFPTSSSSHASITPEAEQTETTPTLTDIDITISQTPSSSHASITLEAEQTETTPTLTGCLPFRNPSDGGIDPSKDVYDFGEVVTVYCRKGFEVNGDETLVCSNSGSWLGEIPGCSPIDSSNLGTIVAVASTVGVVIAIVAIVVGLYYKRRQTNTPKHYATTIPAISSTNAMKWMPEFNKAKTDDSYEIPLNDMKYQDLPKPPETAYQGIYAEIPASVDKSYEVPSIQ